MSQFYDILVAKDYESKKSGVLEKKTAWNKVGTAWNTRAEDGYCMEFFHMPNQRYVLILKSREQKEGDEL